MMRSAGTRSGRLVGAAMAAAFVGGLGACEEQSPVSVDPGGIPVEVRTVEIDIPWSEFGVGVQSFGGFGSPSQIGGVVVANDLGGLLDSRALVRFAPFPNSVAVRNADDVLVQDTAITIRSGRLIALADTAGLDSLTTWTFSAGVVDQPWDPTTATWDLAVDSIGDSRPWAEPGASPLVRSFGESTSVVGESGDSVVFTMDDETLAEWADSADSQRSARVDLVSSDRRVRIDDFVVRLEIGSAVAPDTTVFRDVETIAETFVYSPEPEAPAGVLRAGGAPSWRTVLGVEIPGEVDLPADVCAIVTCPFVLTAESLSRASIVLRSRTTSPAAFQPVDSVLLDVRPVLAPEQLPKSPLGNSLVGQAGFASDAFGASPGEALEIPITGFVRDILDGELEGGPRELALLSLFEPLDLSYVEFDGPDDPGAPILRLLLTVSDPVEYR